MAFCTLRAGPADGHWAGAVSPDGKNAIVFDRDGKKPMLSVYRNGVCLLKNQTLWLKTGAGIPDMSRTVPQPFVRTFTAETPLYTKRSRISLKANGVRLPMGGATLTALATDQGVAFRWETSFPGTTDILNEQLVLRPVGNPELLYGIQPPGFRGDPLQKGGESVHRRSRLADIPARKVSYLPVTFLYPGAALAFTETDVQTYPCLNLTRPTPQADCLTELFANESEKEDGGRRVVTRRNRLARCSGTRTYPWRIFMMADTPSGLYDCDLTEALARPPEGDFSWVEPGSSAWDWWICRDPGIPGLRPAPNNATYEAFIDFAAEFGLRYMLVDDGWARNGNIDTPVKSLDLPKLIAYAKQRGVRLILWTAWQQLIDRQEEVFSRFSKMGIAGVKIDFLARDDVYAAEYLETTARVAAKYRLVLDFHGVHRPDGLTHTWPNILSYEGVYGLEHAKFDGPEIDAVTNGIRIVFTRQLAGPADFTPGAMRNAPRETYRKNFRLPMSMGTRARQAALFVLYDTGFRMLADRPADYRRAPDYTRMLASVPLTWDDTRCDPRSEPDTLALVRRRKGRALWFAGIVGYEERTLTLSVGGEPDTVYTATLIADGPRAPAVATDTVLRTFTVRGADTLTVRCAAQGGFLLRLTPKETGTRGALRADK